MKSAIKTKIRIGKIAYTNCIPYFHRLNANDEFQFEIFETYPQKLNQAMKSGQLDIAPISSLEYLNHQKKYLLLPDFAIGSRDFSGSVILFSKDKIEGLSSQTIAVTRESLSSAILLEIILKFKYKFANSFTVCKSDPDKMLQDYPAALVIGDDALFYKPKSFVYKYDLSELWWNWAEKPFCFALWAVTKEFAKAHPEETRVFCRMLKANLERNLSDLETLVRDSLKMDFLDARFSKIFGYLFNLNFGLDREMREGLELFYRLARRLEKSPAPKNLEFFE